MPLPRQLVTIPLAYGIETKSDPKQIPYGKLLELENGVFDATSSIKKRNGYDQLLDSVANSNGVSSLETASALTTLSDELLCVGRETLSVQDSCLYSYSDGTQNWHNKGGLTPCQIESWPVAEDDRVKGTPVSVLLPNGMQVNAWTASKLDYMQVFYCVIDTKTKQLISPPVSITSGGTEYCNPQIVAVNNKAIIYFTSRTSPQISVAVIDPSQPSVLSVNDITTLALGSDNCLNQIEVNAAFDVCVYNNEIFLAFFSDNNKIVIRRYSSANLLNPLVQDSIAAGSADVRGVFILTDNARNRVSILFTRFTTDWFVSECLLNDPVNCQITAPSDCLQLDSNKGVATTVSAIAVDSAPDQYRYRIYVNQLYPGTLSTTYKELVCTLVIAHTDLAGLPAADEYREICGLYASSKPFEYLGKSFVFAEHNSRTTGSDYNLQNQVVLISDKLNAQDALDQQDPIDIIARVFYQTSCGSFPLSWIDGSPYPGRFGFPRNLSAVSSLDGFSFTVPVLNDMSFGLSPGQNTMLVSGVSSITAKMSSFPLVDNRTEVSDSVFMGNGIAKQYDGSYVTEHAFALWPDYYSTGAGPGIAALTNGATYQIVFVYEWIDAKGYLHQSAPSLPYTFVYHSSEGGNDPQFFVSALYLTNKKNVTLAMYRTGPNGSVFYRDTQSQDVKYNTQSWNTTITINIVTDDSKITSMPPLYTTGGVLENTQLNAVDGLIVHRGRVFAIDSVDRCKVWYSKQIKPEYPLEFSQPLYLSIDNNGGPVTALGSIDDKLIVFKRNMIMMVHGQGPDNTGNNDDFSDSVFVSADCGCIDPRSIVVVPNGLMFQSAKGIYLLDRSLKAVYIGAPVEKYNSEIVESSQLIPSRNQVRLLMSSGVVLVYDYFVGQWSVFTGHIAQDTAIWDNKYCWLTQDGHVMVENQSRFDDNGQFYGLKIKTGWITFGTDAGAYIALNGERAPTAMQSYQRARRVFVLGEYKSPHVLRVQLAYDYNDTPSQDVRITPPDPDHYGDSSPYGNESPYGGEWRLYQWRVDGERQKCQTIQVTISDEQSESNLSETVRLSAVSIDMLLKPGPVRTPMSNVYGS